MAAPAQPDLIPFESEGNSCRGHDPDGTLYAVGAIVLYGNGRNGVLVHDVPALVGSIRHLFVAGPPASSGSVLVREQHYGELVVNLPQILDGKTTHGNVGSKCVPSRQPSKVPLPGCSCLTESATLICATP